jgi:MinD superfamily P-loop ATPase
MKIAVLSGKGGTGKTLVSVNLACAAKQAAYMDCDVEEPNGHLFLKPVVFLTEHIKVPVPKVDASKCTACKKCVDFCEYNALALAKDKLLIFNEICHSCGGCVLICPTGALSEVYREIGSAETGCSENVTVFSGKLNTGEVSGIPIIKHMMKKLPDVDPVVIDCPPGSACIVMESIRDADYCLLVAEPTLFGVHNLDMVVSLVRLFQKPFGVVLNKCLPGENPAEVYCIAQNIPVLEKIPYDEALGRLNAKALIAVREQPHFRRLFETLLERIAAEVKE